MYLICIVVLSQLPYKFDELHAVVLSVDTYSCAVVVRASRCHCSMLSSANLYATASSSSSLWHCCHFKWMLHLWFSDEFDCCRTAGHASLRNSEFACRSLVVVNVH